MASSRYDAIIHIVNLSVAEVLPLGWKLICRIDEGVGVCCAQLRGESPRLAEMRL